MYKEDNFGTKTAEHPFTDRKTGMEHQDSSVDSEK